MAGPAKFKIDGVVYTVDSATSNGQYLVAYACQQCQWSDCTPLHGTETDAMDVAIEEIKDHHAEFHGVIPST